MKRLTKTQESVLNGLKRYGPWAPRPRSVWRCEWSQEKTKLACEMLVKKGFAYKEGHYFYAINGGDEK